MFDIVTCFSVLDHLPNKKFALLAVQEFARVVQSDGHVAITFPNKAFIIGTLSMLLRRSVDKDSFWEQRFTPREFNLLVTACGLVPNLYDYGTASFVGSGIRAKNVPSFFLELPGCIVNALFLLFVRVTIRVLSMGPMRLFGPRFGVLCSPAKHG